MERPTNITLTGWDYFSTRLQNLLEDVSGETCSEPTSLDYWMFFSPVRRQIPLGQIRIDMDNAFIQIFHRVILVYFRKVIGLVL